MILALVLVCYGIIPVTNSFQHVKQETLEDKFKLLSYKTLNNDGSVMTPTEDLMEMGKHHRLIRDVREDRKKYGKILDRNKILRFHQQSDKFHKERRKRVKSQNTEMQGGFGKVIANMNADYNDPMTFINIDPRIEKLIGDRFRRANLACVINGGMSHGCDLEELEAAKNRLKFLTASGPGKKRGANSPYSRRVSNVIEKPYDTELGVPSPNYDMDNDGYSNAKLFAYYDDAGTFNPIQNKKTFMIDADLDDERYISGDN